MSLSKVKIFLMKKKILTMTLPKFSQKNRRRFKAKPIVSHLLKIVNIAIGAELLRNKVLAMSRMMKMFRTLREENEMVVKLKGICPDGKVPKGLL